MSHNNFRPAPYPQLIATTILCLAPKSDFLPEVLFQFHEKSSFLPNHNLLQGLPQKHYWSCHSIGRVFPYAQNSLEIICIATVTHPGQFSTSFYQCATFFALDTKLVATNWIIVAELRLKLFRVTKKFCEI